MNTKSVNDVLAYKYGFMTDYAKSAVPVGIAPTGSMAAKKKKKRKC